MADETIEIPVWRYLELLRKESQQTDTPKEMRRRELEIFAVQIIIDSVCDGISMRKAYAAQRKKPCSLSHMFRTISKSPHLRQARKKVSEMMSKISPEQMMELTTKLQEVIRQSKRQLR